MNKPSYARTQQAEIVKRWLEGRLVTELAREFRCHASIIRDAVIEAVGPETYRQTCKQRTGAGSLKRKQQPKYPKWMQ